MTKDNIGADLVKQTPMMVSQADSSPSAALTATNKQTQQSNQEQVELNKSVGGRRRKKRRKSRHVQHGGAGEGITIPQSNSKDANAGIKQNFTAITKAGSNSQYDNPPTVGGRRKTRRKRRTGHKRRRKKTKSRKKRRHKTKRKRRRRRKNTKKNRK